MASSRTKLRAVKLVYCDEDRVEREVLVDLKQVGALSWCDKVKANHAGSGSKKKVPRTTQTPRPCPKADDPSALSEPDLCWWNGTDWVCGME